MLSTLEESVLNFVQWNALRDQWNDPKSSFATQSITIQTTPNNGIVKTPTITYTNKCCFVSISHGLKSIGIDFIEFIEVTPINLMILANFLEVYTMIDTDNLTHRKCLEKLVVQLPNIQLHFFIGKFVNNTWMSTPDPSVIIGSGKNIIRILNKGSHFEYITTGSNMFLREVKTMTPELVAQLQFEEERKIKEHLESEVLAKKLTVEFEEEERMYLEAVEKRRLAEEIYLKKIRNEENTRKQLEEEDRLYALSLIDCDQNEIERSFRGQLLFNL